MNTNPFPAPNGIPAAIGRAQCTFGVHVHANQISPVGIRIAAKQTTDTIASGGGLPVSGSGLCELIHFRINGSSTMASTEPIPMPIHRWIKSQPLSHTCSRKFRTRVTQSNKAIRPTTQITKDDWICNKAQVQDSVDECNVNIPEDADRLCNSHVKRPRKIDF